MPMNFSPSSFPVLCLQQKLTYRAFFSKSSSEITALDIRAEIDGGNPAYMTVDLMVKTLREEGGHAATNAVWESFISIINKCSLRKESEDTIHSDFNTFIKSIGNGQFPKVNEILQPIALLNGYCQGGNDVLKKYFKTNDIEQIRKYTFIAFGEKETLRGNDPLVDSIIIYAPEDGGYPIDINISSKYGSGYQFSLNSLNFAINKCALNYSDDYVSDRIGEKIDKHNHGNEAKIISDILLLIRNGLSFESIIKLSVKLGIICSGEDDLLISIASSNRHFVTGNSNRGNAIELLDKVRPSLSKKTRELYRAFCIYDRNTAIDKNLWKDSCLGTVFNYSNSKARKNVIENHNGIGFIFWPIVHQITEYLNQSELFTKIVCDIIDQGRIIQISTTQTSKNTSTQTLNMKLIQISDPNKVKLVTCISRNHQGIKLEMKQR